MSSFLKPQHSLIANLNPQERIEGGYRLTDLEQHRTHDGATSWHMKLADRTGAIEAFWPHQELPRLEPEAVRYGDILVNVGFRTRQYSDRMVADLYEFNGALESPEPELALDRLPSYKRAGQRTFDQLADLVNGFGDARLRDAVDALLVNDDLILAWIAQPDDLFVKSVTAACYSIQLPEIDTREREILSIACLFRGLGEVVLYDEWIRNYGGSSPVPEECLTLELCSPALWSLQCSWPEVAHCLRALWGYGLRPIQRTEIRILAAALEFVWLKVRRRKGNEAYRSWDGDDDALCST